MTEVDVELLFWPGCPSYGRAKVLVEQSMLKCGLRPASLRCLEIVTLDDAKRERFVGSPTIRINGADIEPTAEVPSLSCRLYRRSDGRPAALPEGLDVQQALRRALGLSGR